MEFVLGRFSHFNIAIAYSDSLHSVASELQVFVCSLENCPNFSKTSTLRAERETETGTIGFNDDAWKRLQGNFPFVLHTVY